MIHISSNSDNPKVGLYSWVTNMWEHMGPVPRVSDPTAKGSTAKDLVVKKVEHRIKNRALANAVKKAFDEMSSNPKKQMQNFMARFEY
jgi:hypothetical protein